MASSSSGSDNDIEIVQQLTGVGGRPAAPPTSTSANVPLARPSSSAARPATTAGAWAPVNNSPRKQPAAGPSRERGERAPQASGSGANSRANGGGGQALNGATRSNGKGKAGDTLELGSTDDSADDRLPSPKSAFKPPRPAAKPAPRQSLPHAPSSSSSHRPRPAPRKSEPIPRFGAAQTQVSDDSDDEFGISARPAPRGALAASPRKRPSLAAGAKPPEARPAVQTAHAGVVGPSKEKATPQRPAAGTSARQAGSSMNGASASSPQARPSSSASQSRPSTSASQLSPRSSASQVKPPSSSSQPRLSTSSQPQPPVPTPRPTTSSVHRNPPPSSSSQHRASTSATHASTSQPRASTSAANPRGSAPFAQPGPSDPPMGKPKGRIPKVLLSKGSPVTGSAARIPSAASSSAAAKPPSSAVQPASSGAYCPAPASGSRPASSFASQSTSTAARAPRAANSGASRSPSAMPRRPPPAASARPAAARAASSPDNDSDSGSDIEIVSVGGVPVAPASAPAGRRESLAQGAPALASAATQTQGPPASAPKQGPRETRQEERETPPVRREEQPTTGSSAARTMEARTEGEGLVRESATAGAVGPVGASAPAVGREGSEEVGARAAPPGGARPGQKPGRKPAPEVLVLFDDSSDDGPAERRSLPPQGAAAERRAAGPTATAPQPQLNDRAGSSASEAIATPPAQRAQPVKALVPPATPQPRASGPSAPQNGFATSATPERDESLGLAESQTPELALGARAVADRVSTAPTSAGAASASKAVGGGDQGTRSVEEDVVMQTHDSDDDGPSSAEAADDDEDSEAVSPRRHALGKRLGPVISDSEESSGDEKEEDAPMPRASLARLGTARKATGGRPPLAQRSQPGPPAAPQQPVAPALANVLRGKARKATGGRPPLSQAPRAFLPAQPAAQPVPRSDSTTPRPILPASAPAAAAATAPLKPTPPAQPGAARKSSGGRPPLAPRSVSAQELLSVVHKRKAVSPSPSAASDPEAPLLKRQKRRSERTRENLVPAIESEMMPPPPRPLPRPSTSNVPVKHVGDNEKPSFVLGADSVEEDEVVDPVKRAQIEAAVEEFKREQVLKPSWERQIAGPSYDIDDEFSCEVQDGVNRRERDWARQHPFEHPIRDSYKVLFEQMILEANAQEYPPSAPDFRPKIRIVPPTGLSPHAWSSPPFEFIYTNRVVYSDGIVPVQAPGCGCQGDCGNPANRGKCACRLRQIAASRTRDGGGTRSNHADFAYEKDMRLHAKVMTHGDPIVECNSECGCSSNCINRVVGNRQGISVDIYFTGNNGWGVRLPESYRDPILGTYSSRVVRRGEPLAVYAGELLRSKDAHARDEFVYSIIKRNYIYDLDLWTIGEDIRALAPPQVSNRVVVAKQESAHKSVQPAKGKSKGKKKPAVAFEEEPVEIQDDDAFSSLFSVDAFTMGNWTRFANHVCEGFNVIPRPVYVDEGDLSRPLWVYFAFRDIYPGEEINISYFSEEPPDPKQFGYTAAEWIRAADKARKEAPASHRCYCGKRLCRGRMFGSDVPMFYETGEGRGVSG